MSPFPLAHISIQLRLSVYCFLFTLLIQIAILCAIVLGCQAGGYGGSGGGGYSSGSRGGGYSSGGGASYGGGISGSRSAGTAGGTVQAAVRSRHTIEYVDVDLPQDEVVPQVVEVDAGILPLILNFKSASSRIQVNQQHEGAEAGEIQETESEDEPQLLRHSVTKPIIQEVREVITPFRRVIQEIHPVQEEVRFIEFVMLPCFGIFDDNQLLFFFFEQNKIRSRRLCREAKVVARTISMLEKEHRQVAVMVDRVHHQVVAIQVVDHMEVDRLLDPNRIKSYYDCITNYFQIYSTFLHLFICLFINLNKI